MGAQFERRRLSLLHDLDRELSMTQPYTGGCACGAIRYATEHGARLTFAARAEMAITGEASHWEVAGDSGGVKVHAFCPVCDQAADATLTSKRSTRADAAPSIVASSATRAGSSRRTTCTSR